MKTAIITIVLVLLGLAGSVFWTEADKEIEILCGLVNPGQTTESVIELLETGVHLEYEFEGQSIRFYSLKNVYSMSCVIELEQTNEVSNVHLSKHVDLQNGSIVVGSVLTFLLTIFQIALASGGSLGEYAWGGFHKELPISLKRASAVSAILLLIGMLSLLSLNYISLIPKATSAFIIAGFSLMFMFSIVGNLTSVSEKERRVMIPVSVILFLSYFTAAYSAF